ncbi:phosphoglucosamine mutase [Nevskia sp.]|uniref:phosphoglucosamine mutase n=1 Tax=Nevskia sp. TaxID=1929292 RepID=UPI0025E679B5|nr:phosphoglucosamine mutase [Nevskia sp.]
MSRQYFGTDGIRGRVGQAPMTPEFALKLGWAAGSVLARTAGARVLVGKDTRRSGYLFESALEAGFAAAGVETYLLGPLPTPAVAYLTRALRAQAGVVISASHNPHFDNGVKFFSAEGDKLSDALEAEIESFLERDLVCVPPELMGRARRIDDAQGRYIEFCKGAFAGDSLRGLKLVVDCANGASYKVAPAVFAELGAQVVPIGINPNGLNINEGCGSTHLQALTRAVAEHGADLGIALDGDGDRCLMVCASGQTVDGDEILYVIAQNRHRAGLLRGPVVGTVMSNFGLEKALTDGGIDFRRAAVGDRHVLEMLRATGGIVGGETSGHTICLDRARTGDGIITALQILEAMQASGQSLSGLVAGMTKLPQVLLNVPVTGKAKPVLDQPRLKLALGDIEAALSGRGRVLLRASGTEPVIRVMVEADQALMAQQAAESLADAVRASAAGMAM